VDEAAGETEQEQTRHGRDEVPVVESVDDTTHDDLLSLHVEATERPRQTEENRTAHARTMRRIASLTAMSPTVRFPGTFLGPTGSREVANAGAPSGSVFIGMMKPLSVDRYARADGL
jgi:hypothetical protein